jgi:hypothetical protein
MLKQKAFALDEDKYKKIVTALLYADGIDVLGHNFETQRLFSAGINPVRVASMGGVLLSLQKVPLGELSGRLNKHFLTKRCGNR